VEDHLTRSKEALAAFHTELQNAEIDVEAEAKNISTGDAKTSQASADKIINLSMASAERLSTELADSLASNASLTEGQREYFRKFSAARAQENSLLSLGDVSQQVYFGKAADPAKGLPRMLGIKDYRSEVGAALASGNKRAADIMLSHLGKFVADHAQKAALAESAFKAAKASPQTSRLVSDGQGGWSVKPGAWASEQARIDNGGLNIHGNSGKVVSELRTESDALTAAQDELTAAYNNKFGGADVKNVSQPQEQQAVPSKSSEEAKTETGADQGSGNGQPKKVASVQSDEKGGVTKATEEAPASSANSAENSDQLQSNEGTTVEPEGQTAEGVPEAHGPGLSVLSNKTAEEELPAGTKLGAVYRKINKVVAFLKQSKVKVDKDADIAKDRPLVSVQNLMALWRDGTVTPSDFFPDGLMDAEIGALNTFQKFHDQWAPLIRANLIKGGLPNLKSGKLPNPEFAFEDPLQDFFNEDGSIDENVVTAIAYGAYSWLVDSMNNPALKQDEDILKMHGVQDGEVSVSSEGRQALRGYAAFQDTAAAAIGRYVVDSLGLKANDKAVADYLSKVKTAFGLQALVLLASDKVNMVNFDTISGDVLNEYLPGINIEPTGRTQGRVNKAGEQIEARDTYPMVTYIGIRRNSDFSLPDNSKSIADSSVGAFGVLERLFSTENSGTNATWKPIKFTQQRAKRTGQSISKMQRKILEKAQAVEHRIIPDMWTALFVLGDNVILQAAGWQEYVEDKIQAENRGSVQAKNQGLEHQLDGMKTLVQGAIDNSPEGINQPFFQALEVWRNFRVGVSTRDMNLQSSKIHRFMFFRPEWASKIDLQDQASKDAFLLTVAQAFGVKVDQQTNAESVAMFNERMAADNGAIKTLAMDLSKALANPKEEVLTPGQKSDIGQFASDREGMQTLQALVAYGNYLVAEQRGDASVDVHMLVGIDGKTNGPILTHLALGAATSADELFTAINRGGMYRDADGVKNYNHWYKRAASLDLYQDLAHKILQGIKPSPNLAAIYTITKDMLKDGKVTSAGRNLAKTPLTAFIFGSSIDKSIENMKSSFIQNVFDRIEDVATGRDKETSTAELVKALNTLMGTKLPANTTIEQLMGKTFTKQEKDALANAFYETIGTHVEETMKSYFDSYLTRRNAVNKALQGSFAIYHAIYADLRAKEMNRLMDEGEISFTETKAGRIPDHDMTVEQEQVLRDKVKDIMPWAPTAYTQGTDETDAGIFMAKTRQAVSDAEHNKVKVQLGNRIPSKANPNWSVSTVTGYAMNQVETSPGVAGLPYFMHSLDSFIMHESLDGTDTLNVHDEAGNGVNNVNRTAERINAATWKGMLNFSPATEAFNLLARTVTNAVKLIEAGDVSPEAMAAIRESLIAQLPFSLRGKVTDAELPLLVLTYANSAQFDANKIRLEALTQMTSIDQYTWEGGQYDVTQADRDQAQKMLEQHLLTERLSPEMEAAADALGKALAENDKVKEAKAEKIVLEQDKTGATPFGELGKPLIPSDPALVAFFKANPKATAKQVITMLAEPGRLNDINRKLLMLVSRTVKPELLVQFVTAATAQSDVIDTAGRPARGWYVVNGDQEAIYVLSPEFKSSGLTTETLLHELIHAAVATVIDSPSAAAKELVTELETLMHKAAEYAQAAGLSEFADALSDVQEFVAWGMSNRDLQEKVLAKISVPTKTGSNVLVQGMKKFINTLTQLLWKNDEAVNNGLSVLVSNVSGLFYEAGQQKATGTKLNLAQATVAAIEKYTTLDIHAALANGAVSSAFQFKQAKILTSIVERLHGPFGTFAAQMRKTEAGNPLAVWLKAIETGKAPFASDLVNKGFSSSAQEDFVMEQVQATVSAALDLNEVSTKPAYRELYKLYVETKAKLTVADFVNAGLTAADYQFVFGVSGDAENRSDYLSRFAALGLGSEKFNSLLKFETTTGRGDLGNAKSMFDRLVKWFESMLATLNAKATNTFIGQDADQKLVALVDRLMDIEAKHRASLTATESRFNQYTATFEAGTKKVVDAGKQKILDLAMSPAVQKSKSGALKWAATLAAVPLSGRTAQYMHNLRSVRDHMFDERDGVIAGLLREAKGPGDVLEALILATKHAENGRQNAINQTADVLLKEFGASLEEHEKAALTLLLRSGAHNLLSTYSLPEVQQLLADPAALNQAIADTQAKLTTRLKDQHVAQANALGYWKATDLNASKFLMKNSYVIARMLGTQYAGQISEAEALQEQDTIATLATLYGLKYSSSKDVKMVADLMGRENARGDGNGVELMLKLHQEMEQESKARLFNNNPIQMVHGYTPEIYDPYVTIKVASAADGKDLIEQGYELQDGVASDKDVPDANGAYGVRQGLYVRKDGGLSRRVSGAMSLTSRHHKGTTIHNGYMNVNTFAGAANASTQVEVTNKKLAALASAVAAPNADLSKTKEVNVAPIYDDQGNVVNWAHLMGGQTKDNVLKRENRFEKVMGAFAGSIVDKHTSEELNEKAITALRDQYNIEKATSPWSYVEVGPLSNDPELREQWHLLPAETRIAVRKIWGRDGMMVRKDSLDGIFGYRKVSAADFLNKERADLKGMESIARAFFHSIAKYRGMDDHAADSFAKRMGVYVTQGERGWQEVYKEVKDIIVVKSGVVLLGNIFSNASLLWLMGVDDGWSKQLTALRGIMAYETDHKRLMELESKRDAGYGNADANEIARLKDAIARNPVTKLIDAGLMPSIVEDVDLQDDPFSYKTQLGERVDAYVSKVPERVRTVAKHVWMSHDTPQYKFLSRATQYSDFVARYALYEHLVNNEKKSHEEAIKKSLRAFVHYDVPMQRTLQYMDDMGFTPFMKYFYRIQSVLMETARERPARFMAMVLLNRMVDLGPIVLDSSVMHHAFNNPFHGGALRIGEVTGELATVQAAMALVK
jgi:hypothetical protein